MTKEMFTAIKIIVKLLHIIIKVNILVLLSLPSVFPLKCYRICWIGYRNSSDFPLKDHF